MKIPDWAFLRLRHYQPTVFALVDRWLDEQKIGWGDAQYNQLLPFFDKFELIASAVPVARMWPNGSRSHTWRVELLEVATGDRTYTPANDMSREEAEQTAVERCFHYLEKKLTGKTPRSYELDKGEGTLPPELIG